jgi:hypothetical protein
MKVKHRHLKGGHLRSFGCKLIWPKLGLDPWNPELPSPESTRRLKLLR